MQTKSNQKNQQKMCAIANKWLIITTCLATFSLSSCVPPMNHTTGERAGKRELHNMSSYSHAKSKKYKNTNKQKQFDVNFSNAPNDEIDKVDGGEIDAIQEFEKRINQRQNNSKQEKPKNSPAKPLPSLKEQIEKLNENQSVMEERILNVMGDILEIKSILSDMDGQRFKPTTGRENFHRESIQLGNNPNNSNSNRNDLSNTQASQAIENNFGNQQNQNMFLISSDEEATNNNAKNNSDNMANSAVNSTVPANQNNQKKVETKSQTNNQNASTNKNSSNTNNNPNNKKQANSTAPNNSNSNNSNPNNSNANNVAENNSKANEKERDFSDIINKVAKGEYAAATKLINEKLNSTTDPVVIANCNYWLGECSFNQRDYAKSITYFKSVLDSTGDKKDVAQARIAESYLRVGKNEEAKTAYQNLLRDFPRSTHSPRAKKMLQRL